ncbi:MAG: glutamate synthase subunit beta [Candidatus Omnitrophica bacterium]|nr:glutamate synthase subunit beta [Candidatus Omnitrophota bacterium]
MGDTTGFLKYERKEFGKETVAERLRHYCEFVKYPPEVEMQTQGARCMECGIPFCHWGCPISNLIPDWNDLVYKGKWQEAVKYLQETNNFPEFTGRICPAPCENSCVLSINAPAVAIKNIEVAIIEKAFKEGWIKPNLPKVRTGKAVAVVGSGPAGLACADQLNKAGHTVTVYEKNEDIGGLLRLGIPDFKLDKKIVQRRVDIMAAEGVVFKPNTHVGVDIKAQYLRKNHDAVVLSGGAELPRDLAVPGRELKGIYFAMDYLTQQNRVNKGKQFTAERIDARGKNVVVIGGGDTGSDCVGTANRQGAKSVKQFELLPEPPVEREWDNPWPHWAFIKRTSTSHEEGCERHYAVLTKAFTGEGGQVKRLEGIKLEFGQKDHSGRRPMKEIAGSEFSVNCDLVFLAMGFLGPAKNGMLEELGVEIEKSGNVKSDSNYMTNVPGVFACGDLRRGQSLVVWAINEGRTAALSIDRWLMGQ